MHIALLCATERGLRILRRLSELRPNDEITVFSFLEQPHEPPFTDRIRSFASSRTYTFYETHRLDTRELVSFWESTSLDLMLLVNWRYLLPKKIYEQPKFGTYVFHDSLLPSYRGFSPTIWSMINGESQTGVTLFEISERIDEGAIIDQESIPIGSDETISVILERVTTTYLKLLERNIDNLLMGKVKKRRQDQKSATYTCKRIPTDNEINWNKSSSDIFNLIRAVTYPYPGAFTSYNGKMLTVWQAKILVDFPAYVGRIPGRIVEVRAGEGSVVLTGDGALLLTEIQFEGGKIRCAADLLTSLSDTLGR